MTLKKRRKMDRFIVRFSVLALNIYMIVVLLFALNGIDISVYDYIFTDSVLFGIVLTVLCHVQGRYHCKWIRALCYNLIAIPMINFIDYQYEVFTQIEYYFAVMLGIIAVSITSTLILAINHFRRVRKVLKKNRYEELKPIKCNCTRKD